MMSQSKGQVSGTVMVAAMTLCLIAYSAPLIVPAVKKADHVVVKAVKSTGHLIKKILP